MKVLVAVKRVVDYNVKVHPRADGEDVELTGLKMSINPFDEIAVEAAVQLKEAGKASEVVAVSIGPEKAADTLRVAMAIGADCAVHVRLEPTVEPFTVARILEAIVRQEAPDLVLTGKQAIDNDAGQVTAMLSALLGWPVATCVSKIELADKVLTVCQESDAGLKHLTAELPAVLSADLRLAEPRYVTLPSMMKARKKPIETVDAATLGIDLARKTEICNVTEPNRERASEKLDSVDELLFKLIHEKKVIKEMAQ